MPSVFPATGAAGRDPRSFEVVLVKASLAFMLVVCDWSFPTMDDEDGDTSKK
jgi:hypothetical protein